MKVIEKGNIDYLKSRKKSQLIFTLCFIFVIIALLVIGYLLNKTRNNIFTVIAIVTVLPTAKFLVGLIVLYRCKNPDIEKYQQLKDLTNQNVSLLTGLCLTCKDKSIYIEFALITDSCIYCYSNNDKINTNYFETNIEEFIKSCGDVVNVKLIKNFDTFCERAKNASITNGKEGKVQRVTKDLLILAL